MENVVPDPAAVPPAPASLPPAPRIELVEVPHIECALPPFDTTNTPSRPDGISEELETDLRIVGCTLIQNCGIIMKQPEVRLCRLMYLYVCGRCDIFFKPFKVVMACAQILFQRYYYRKSFLRKDLEVPSLV